MFLLVAIGAYRQREQLQARTWLLLVAITVSGVVLAGFALDLLLNDRRSLGVALLLVVVALVVDGVWTRKAARS